MSAVVASVVMGASTIYAASRSSSASKAASASNERAAKGLQESADYAADQSYKLGSEQLSFARQQYDELKPIASRISEQQIQAQDEQMRQAKDYYDYQTGTFRPLEQGLVADAQRFDTEAYKETLARDAAAAAGRAFATTQSASQRANASMNVNPNSGRAAGMSNQNDLGLAAMRSNAMTGARNQADQIGYARKLDVTGLGRGLSGASTAAYNSATGAGSAGINTAMAPGGQYNLAYGQGANTIMTGAGQRIQGYANMYNTSGAMVNSANSNLLDFYGATQGQAGKLVAQGIGLRKFNG
jgi:hypothetical protein